MGIEGGVGALPPDRGSTPAPRPNLNDYGYNFDAASSREKAALMKLWKFRTTDIRELKLKQAEEVTKAGTDAAKAVLDLAKTVHEQGSKVEVLKEYVGQISSLLDVLNSPLAQIVKDTISFAPLAVGIVKLIAEATKKEPTLEQCMALVSQAAYLESMRSLLKPYINDLEQKEQQQQAKASEAIARQLKQLGDQEFTEKDARDALLPTLAQQTMRMLKDSGVQTTGQRQVDVYTGLNALILLLELHRYAQNQTNLKDKILFYPSGNPSEAEDERTSRLLKVIHYSDSLDLATFTNIAGLFLSSAILISAILESAILISAILESAILISAILESAILISADLESADLISADLESAILISAILESAILISADLESADLISADLISADLESAILFNADLESAILISADLESAILISADLSDADLTDADLTDANLNQITWTAKTKWEGVKGLKTVKNAPPALVEQWQREGKV
jgi:uncharacterized protein YjbI with pentapeptide repeats